VQFSDGKSQAKTGTIFTGWVKRCDRARALFPDLLPVFHLGGWAKSHQRQGLPDVPHRCQMGSNGCVEDSHLGFVRLHCPLPFPSCTVSPPPRPSRHPSWSVSTTSWLKFLYSPLVVAGIHRPDCHHLTRTWGCLIALVNQPTIFCQVSIMLRVMGA